MKRFISILVFVTIGLSVAFAQKTFSSGQRALRDNIKSYLQEEGYQPSLDSDGDIKFKRQGDVYFICVSAKDESPYYVRLSKYFSYSDKISKSKIALYYEAINQYKMIKLITTDDSFIIDAQMYLINSVSFTSIFNKVLSVMDGAEEELK